MKAYIQILGTDTVDVTPSLLFVCDNKRYLFNAGEGTQRLCLEHYVPMGQISSVFLSKLSWEEIGGLPGLVLTTTDTGLKSLNVCGPSGTQDFVTSTRFYLQRNDFFMNIKEFKGDTPPPYVDSLIKVFPIVLDPSNINNDISKGDEIEMQTNSDGEEVETAEVEEEGEGDEGDDEMEEEPYEPLKGTVYIPSAKKNQKLNIRPQNVQQVISLMFSKRRQLTEYEEMMNGKMDEEYYDTGYTGRRRSEKKARKRENLNFEKETAKLNLARNDARLLEHADYFLANPGSVRVEEYSDDEESEADMVDDLTQANKESHVVLKEGGVPNSETCNKESECSKSDNDANAIQPSSSDKVTDKPSATLPTPTSSAISLSYTFDSSSLSSFPSLLATPPPASSVNSSFPSPFPSFSAASPFGSFSFGTPNANSTNLPPLLSSEKIQESDTTEPTTSTIVNSDIFGNSASAPVDIGSIFGNSNAKLFDVSKIETPNSSFGNSSLFSAETTYGEEKSESKKDEETRDTEKQSKVVLCFACHMQDILRIDYDRANELGVTPHQIEMLREGKTVKSEKNGKDIAPQDCFADPVYGPRFLVIFCPSMEYMALLINNRQFEEYFEDVEFVVHITHHDVLMTPQYQNWMHNFCTIKHVIINKEVCPHHYVYPTSAIHQFRMNTLHKDIFPLPFYKEASATLPNKCPCGCGAEFTIPVSLDTDIKGLPENTTIGEIFLQMVLFPLPQQGSDPSDIMRGTIGKCNVALQRLKDVPDLTASMNALQLLISENERENPPSPLEPRLLFLGTGSALPSKYRNVSGIYFEVEPGKGMLIDAGEGSYGQLYRRFGAQLNSVVATIKVAWLSHIHADHHLGIIRILLKRSELTTAPLVIVGPRPVGRWLAEYNENVEKLNYDFVDCADITSSRNYMKPFFETTFGLKEFYTVEVAHCSESFGLIMSHKHGWKLVVSGDTRPCERLEKEGKDAFLVIHEATLESGLEPDAHQKGHSTTKQAVESCERMNAKWIILNHFSQKYPNVPALSAESASKIGVAYDLMDIRWSSLPLLPALRERMAQILAHEDAIRTDASLRTRAHYAQLHAIHRRMRTGPSNRTQAAENNATQNRTSAEDATQETQTPAQGQTQARTQTQRIRFLCEGEDEDMEDREREECEKNGVFFNKFGRGRARGFYWNPIKKRGKVSK